MNMANDFFQIAEELIDRGVVINHQDFSMLAYMAPEHSRRLNMPLDHRSDLYSIGVMLYKRLTGELPFKESEPEALLHEKLTQYPVSPDVLNPAIPKMLSNIILKLLSQKPVDRYQSVLGLKQDLLYCQESSNFTLGQFDYDPVFKMPEKLYGREEELKQLRNILNEIDPTGVEVLIVSGYSGIGKTTIIHALEGELVTRGGYFAMGKFGQQKQNIAYSGLGDLFGHLIRQILSEGDVSISQWREKLLTALGKNGQVIIDIVPELKLLIGEQPALLEMGSVEAKNRFDYTFQKFISVFSNPKHPLALFLDDLQWADLASLDALRLILENDDERSLLLLGAYRDNEVDSMHPLNILFEEVKQKRINVHDMLLKPLKIKDIENWVGDAVCYFNQDVIEVSRWIYEKTAGNPFYIKLFLRILHEENLIFLNKQNNTWSFNIPAIQSLPATQNVGDLMSRRLAGLSQELQYTLQVAACFGNKFEENMLKHMLTGKVERVTDKLIFLASLGLLFKNEDFYHFVHDQVQSSALNLLSENDTKMIHLHIGKTLLNVLSEEEREESIAIIAEHLNRGKIFLSSKKEKIELVRLNLYAATKAKSSMAYQAACDYLDGCKNLIDENPQWFWVDNAQLTFDFYYTNADLLFLLHKNDVAEQHCNTLLNYSEPAYQKNKVGLLRIKHYVAHGKLDEAIAQGIYELDTLGIHIPATPSDARILLALWRVKFLMRKIENEKDLKQFVSNDPLHEMIMQIFMEIIPATHDVGNFRLTTLFAANACEYSLKNGITYSFSYSLIVYAAVMCFVLKKPKLGLQYGKLALKVNEMYDNDLLTGRLNLIFSTHLGNWVMPFKECIGILNFAIQKTLESSDFFYNSSAQLFETILKASKSDLTYHDIHKENAEIMKKGFTKLVYLDLDARALMMYLYDSLNRSSALIFKKDIHVMNEMALLVYSTTKAMVCYHYERYEKAYVYVCKSKRLADERIGNTFIIFYYFYLFLSSAKLFKKSPLKHKPKYFYEMFLNYREFRFLRKACPENFSYYIYIMEAEFASIAGFYKLAAKRYDQAITISKKSQFLLDEAQSNELAAKFHLENGHEKIASIYMQETRDLYRRWGADAKIAFLEKQYPNLLPKEEVVVEENRSTNLSDLIDMQSVLKTSQAISSTLELDKLLSKLLKIMLQNAGAEKGYFIQLHENRLQIIAAIEKENTSVYLSSPELLIDDSRRLAASVVNYVKNTQESIVLGDAVKDSIYQHDGYIKQYQPKSILCLPILKQEKLLGILYLENNRATDIFTHDRVALLKMLSTQAAISLENAFLFESNQKAQQRIQQHQTEIAHYARVNTLSELATGLAHEINQPLASSLNYLGGCLERLKLSETSPDIIAGVEKASIGIERAGEIIQHLRASIKKQDIMKKMINVNDVINHVLPLLNYKIKSTQTELMLNLSDNLPEIYADTLQIEQVLINLINNALEALLEVDADKRKLIIATHCNQTHIEIKIRDTGFGIDPSIQEKLFQPFMTTKPEGLGMGLAICKTIIETYSGEIKVEKYSDGTTFYIALPLCV